MKIVEQTELSNEQKSRIVELWNAEYPSALAHSGIASFDDYLSNLADKKHFLVFDETGEIAGWTCVFGRDNARWFSIIIDGKAQGKGLGVMLIDAIKATEKQFFGWVIVSEDYEKANGEKYRSPLGFYKRIGFIVHDGEKLFKENISGVKIEWNA